MSWADRILSFVENGDFLSAITIAEEYYRGIAPGNRLGLPEDSSAMRSLVGQRIRDLMTASARFAFAEERLTDSTHVTPDGRGVDRTSLFEGLVDVCVQASLAMNEFDFVFEDLFDYYQNSGIIVIFLKRLEPFILDGRIHAIPPRITQCLIAMHQENGDLNKAERVIWHIDPDCLDVDQAIALCRNNHLYDALIYVYTRSLHDYVTPVAELLDVIRTIQKSRRSRGLSSRSTPDDLKIIAMGAYKVYLYLADVLSGLVFPSQQTMPPEEAFQAKNDIYGFLFSLFETGQLILASEEENVSDPTYPYVRLLLGFDSEAFLHALDIAFEDDYFNDDVQVVNRVMIVQILLKMLSAPEFSPTDLTMLNIFIARNVAKYPQSIHTHMSSKTLHSILVGLAEDPDRSSKEDRQLAAEYLLSIYAPHDGDKMASLFEMAEFYRILRTWYRQEQKWYSLISTYLRDSDIDPADIFECLDEILADATRINKGKLPAEAFSAFEDALLRLLQTELSETALLVDKYIPSLHRTACSKIDNFHQQFVYLRCLVEPSTLSEEMYWSHSTIRNQSPSMALDASTRELYIDLLCRYDAHRVIECLNNAKEGYFSWKNVITICQRNGIFDAVVWCLNKTENSTIALNQLKSVTFSLTSELQDYFGPSKTKSNVVEIQQLVGKLKALGETGLQICSEIASNLSVSDASAEDLWFTLLSSQIDVTQTVSSFCGSYVENEEEMVSEEQQTLNVLRSLVQTTFSSLMASGSFPGLSLPRLFKRLVDSASKERSSGRSSYSEFRLILTGMLDSYRAEGDLLLITNHLIQRDLFFVVEEYTKRQYQGARARDFHCSACKCSLEPVQDNDFANLSDNHEQAWMIQRISGMPFHRKCLPIAEDFS